MSPQSSGGVLSNVVFTASTILVKGSSSALLISSAVTTIVRGNPVTRSRPRNSAEDSSGIGNASDERNDFIVGQNGVDITLTSEERRILAHSSGNIPLQPISSVVSVSGSSSGAFSPKSISSSGIITGSYEIIKDTNPDTGGSPFGYDRLHFISGSKSVSSEVGFLPIRRTVAFAIPVTSFCEGTPGLFVFF